MVHAPTASGVDDAQPLMLSMPLIVGAGFREDSRLLNQSTRMEIYNFVRNNPGTHFRGICDNLGLPIGVVQYHLGVLSRAGFLFIHSDKRYRRYFESKRFGEAEMKMICLLRHETVGKILAILSQRDSVFHKDLASELDVSSQALIWQINRLKKMRLVEAVKEGLRVKYFLNEENVMTVRRCLDFVS